MKKIAYLISAYTEPATLANLVETLYEDWTDIFIHIDKKVDIRQFTKLIKKDNVFWIPEDKRVRVMWGGVLAGSNAV